MFSTRYLPRPKDVLHVFQRRYKNVTEADDLVPFSFGPLPRQLKRSTHIFMPKVLQELQFAVRPL